MVPRLAPEGQAVPPGTQPHQATPKESSSEWNHRPRGGITSAARMRVGVSGSEWAGDAVANFSVSCFDEIYMEIEMLACIHYISIMSRAW